MEISNSVDILLVEDNTYDIDLTLRALDKHHLASKAAICHSPTGPQYYGESDATVQ